MVKVSVILPSLNEEATIGTCIAKIQAVFQELQINGEIIVADSSTDSSATIARQMGAKIVNPAKYGYGNACLAGLSKANGDYIIIGDSDGTYDFAELLRFLKILMNDEADFVIGSRLRGDIKKGAMPWLHQYIGNPLLTRISNWLFKTNISDAHSGLRGFTRETFKSMKLRAPGMEFASEMFFEAAKNNLRIKEVPISYYPRIKSHSKLRSFSDGWRHLRLMLLYSPTEVIFLPGIVLFFLGLFLTLLLMFGPVRFGNMGLYIHPMILGNLLLIIGFQILILGLYTKVYGAVHGMSKPDEITKIFLNYHSLEKELLLGGVLFFIGLAIDLNILLTWINKGFGELGELRNAILASSIASLGIQMIFSALFISVLLLEKKEENEV